MRSKVGEEHRCPECGNLGGRIVWKSEDGETIGIECARSGHRHRRDSVILVSLKKDCICSTPKTS